MGVLAAALIVIVVPGSLCSSWVDVRVAGDRGCWSVDCGWGLSGCGAGAEGQGHCDDNHDYYYEVEGQHYPGEFSQGVVLLDYS